MIGRQKQNKTKQVIFAVPDLIPNFLAFICEKKSKFSSLELEPSVSQGDRE